MFGPQEEITKLFRKLNKELPGVATDNVCKLLIADAINNLAKSVKPEKDKVINVLCKYPDGDTTSLGYVVPNEAFTGRIEDLWKEFQDAMDAEHTNDDFIPFIVDNYGFTVHEFNEFSHVTLNSD